MAFSTAVNKFKVGLKLMSLVSYALALVSQANWRPASSENLDQSMQVDTSKLEKQIAGLTEQVKKQNQLQHRLLLGLAAGVGTALGATVVAALVLLLLRPIFNTVGLGDVLPEKVEIQNEQ